MWYSNSRQYNRFLHGGYFAGQSENSPQTTELFATTTTDDFQSMPIGQYSSNTVDASASNPTQVNVNPLLNKNYKYESVVRTSNTVPPLVTSESETSTETPTLSDSSTLFPTETTATETTATETTATDTTTEKLNNSSKLVKVNGSGYPRYTSYACTPSVPRYIYGGSHYPGHRGAGHGDPTQTTSQAAQDYAKDLSSALKNTIKTLENMVNKNNQVLASTQSNTPFTFESPTDTDTDPLPSNKLPGQGYGHGSGSGHRRVGGYGHGHGSGSGYGHGHGSGSGYGYGHGSGSGHRRVGGYGHGSGSGSGSRHGNGRRGGALFEEDTTLSFEF